MLILGIDPGETTGWAIYDTEDRRCVVAGRFPKHHGGLDALPEVDHVVIERPKGQGPTRPQVVECGIVFGRLIQWAESHWRGSKVKVHELLRYEIKSILSAATHGEVNARNDASVWAALLLLHGGEEAGRKATKKNPVPGALGMAKSHERAAVAVAVAWSLREGV